MPFYVELHNPVHDKTRKNGCPDSFYVFSLALYNIICNFVLLLSYKLIVIKQEEYA
jgi:hypothetical protein